MAVLGHRGRLRLRREAPEPTVLRPGNVNVASNSIYMRNPAFWSGDLVTLSCVNGLPLDASSGGPDCPDGYGVYYGSDWYLGSNRSHITSETSNFYTASGAVQFYMRQEEAGLTTSADYYCYRDQLDRLSFYTTRTAALNGSTAARISLYKVDFNALIVSAAGSTEYQNAIAECSADIGDYAFSDVQDEVSLASICDFAPEYTAPPAWITEYDNADLTPRYYVNAGTGGTLWAVQADIVEWSLNLTSSEVDTTAVGERFGDAVKAVVTGGGTIDFLVERENRAETARDTSTLLRLLLLIERGCKADAQFWMITNREDSNSHLLPGDLYYETQLMVTSTAINTRADELIAGSLNFVTVGEIALREGTN